jgi:hypothetical protein
MARFTMRKLPFGHHAGDDEDDGTGLPTPARIKLEARRAAGIREAKEVLAHLPAAGESLHALCTSRFDLTDVIAALVGKLGRCERCLVATLGYNQKNLSAMLSWLDTGAIQSLTLLASIFFRSHNGAMWGRTLREFQRRGQRAACCHSHAKVVTLAFADGTRLSIEGSANLCGNGSGREQFCLVNHALLHDWHAAWISDLVTKHAGKETQTEETDQGAD